MLRTWFTKASAAGALALLVACSSPLAPPAPPAPPAPGPGPTEPVAVQQACALAQWGVPLAEQYITAMPPTVQQALAIVQAALPACAAGNATEAIVDAVNALAAYLTSQGQRPPPGVPARIIVRR